MCQVLVGKRICLHNSTTVENKLLGAVLDSFLTQHVTDFTRHCPGQRPSILDLVFTDDPNSIDCIQHYPLLVQVTMTGVQTRDYRAVLAP